MLHRRKTVAGLLAAAAMLVLTLGFAQAGHAATLSGPYEIRNFGSGLCVENPITDGTNVQLIQDNCNGSLSQLWIFDPIDNSGNYHIINLGSGACMRAKVSTDSSPVDTVTCSAISDTDWTLGQSLPLTVPSQIINHVSGHTSFLFDSLGSTSPGGQMVVFHNSANNPFEVWTTVPIG